MGGSLLSILPLSPSPPVVPYEGVPTTRRRERPPTETPEWIEVIVEADFTTGCHLHVPPRNELTRFCIDCLKPICFKCVAEDHHEHKLLRIYRNSRKEAILVEELGKHVDCGEIQQYRCNMQEVVAITPLLNGKTNGPSCDICERRLIDHVCNKYCSLSCKVRAFERKDYDDGDPPFLALPPNPPKKRNRRKGIPHRAPMH